MNIKKTDLDLRFIVAFFAAIIFALLFAYQLIVSGSQDIADPEKVQAKIGHMGEVVGHEIVPSTGLTAWKIRPEGLDRQFIFYTTPNGKALLTGSIWDAESGTEISTGIELVQESMLYNQEAGAAELNAAEGSAIDAAASRDRSLNEASYASTSGVGEALGEYDGDTPIIFDLLTNLRGFKTSEAAPSDTVFVFYDPRCPVCEEAHEKIDLIDLEAKGLAVKWLPTTALGNTADGRKRAAVAFNTEDYKVFSDSIGGDEMVDSVTDLESEYLEDNLQVLVTAAHETYGEDYDIKVPAAIYLNKTEGKPKLLFSLSSDAALKTIFGE